MCPVDKPRTTADVLLDLMISDPVMAQKIREYNAACVITDAEYEARKPEAIKGLEEIGKQLGD